MKRTILIIILSIVLLSCATKAPYIDPIPTHTALILTSTLLDEERTINIWTPSAYENSTERFPVLYMPDGGIQEDFPHIANTLAKLIANKSIPPFILVGIENTVRRRDLTGFSAVAEDEQYCPLTDGAKDFRSFIIDELMPEIDEKYRTTTTKGIIGESLAGLFVMETFFLTPSVFDFYIAMDPSLWWNDHYLEKNAAEFLRNFPEQPVKLWFAGSGAKDISAHTTNLAKTLEENCPKSLTWNYSNEPKEKHNTIFKATKEKALIWTLN